MSDAKARAAEHERLQAAVIAAAKDWRQPHAFRESVDEALMDAVDALVAFDQAAKS